MKKLFPLFACFLALLTAAPTTACAPPEDAPTVQRPSSDGSQDGSIDTPFFPGEDMIDTLPEQDSLPPGDAQTPILPEQKPSEPTVSTPVVRTAEYVSVRVNSLSVRSGAGTGYSSLGTVEKGDMLCLVQKKGSWYETRYRSRTAYVSANEAYTTIVSLKKSDERIESVVSEGVELLGTPYVYGATRLHDGKGNFLKGFTVTKFDCSSLMQYIFYQGAGILLDVTTRTQVKQGTAVAWKDIQRGDLLFFTNAQRYDKTGIERIGHVALYLGENYILHTASDYAVIEQMSATRKSYFITARRLL